MPRLDAVAARRGAARRTWLRVHRWLALVVGAVFVLLGLSGTMLALKKPLLRWELGGAVLDGRTLERAYADPARWRESALAAYPQMAAAMGAVPPHQGFFDSDNATVFGRPVGRRGMAVAMVDAWDATPRGFFVYDDLWMAKVVALHRSLLLPPPIGGPLLAGFGVLLLVSTVSGIWLWWPRNGRWRAQLAPMRGSRGLRRWLEWHRLSAWLALPMMLLAVTGIYLAILPGRPGGQPGGVREAMAALHGHLLLGAGWGAGLVAACGLMLVLLYVTGLWLWWHRRR